MCAPSIGAQMIPPLVEQLEAADMLHLIRQIDALKTLDPTASCAISPVAGGTVLTSSPEYGHKLNRAVGLGIWGSLTAHEIDEVERLFTPTGLHAKIDICPYAGTEAFDHLRQWGYSEAGAIVELALDLSSDLSSLPIPHSKPEMQLPITIRRVKPNEDSAFISTCVEGFLPNGRSRTLLSTLARIALAREDTTLYFALIDGAIAGAAGLSFLETAHGKVAQLYIDSTLPTYQGRGVHAALIRERVHEAKLAGCALAMMSAREGSGSARNAVRAGFELVYSKIQMIQDTKERAL